MIKFIANLVKEFKEFALRGNVLELAIGLTVGAGFRDLVSSIVNDIVMPPVGFLLGRVSFSNLYLNLSKTKYSSLEEAQAAGAPTVNYGLFLNSLIEFLIVAFVIFVLVRAANRLNRKEKTTKKPESKKCPYCFSEIPIEATRCPKCTSRFKK